MVLKGENHCHHIIVRSHPLERLRHARFCRITTLHAALCRKSWRSSFNKRRPFMCQASKSSDGSMLKCEQCRGSARHGAASPPPLRPDPASARRCGTADRVRHSVRTTNETASDCHPAAERADSTDRCARGCSGSWLGQQLRRATPDRSGERSKASRQAVSGRHALPGISPGIIRCFLIAG